MNRTTWIRLERWYTGLNRPRQWSVKIGLVSFVICCALVVAHEPTERQRQSKIILNCDHCGSDLDRTMTYNEYQDQREQTQRSWFHQEKQRLQQEIWNEKGRERWCRNHPHDRNCG